MVLESPSVFLATSVHCSTVGPLKDVCKPAASKCLPSRSAGDMDQRRCLRQQTLGGNNERRALAGNAKGLPGLGDLSCASFRAAGVSLLSVTLPLPAALFLLTSQAFSCSLACFSSPQAVLPHIYTTPRYKALG